MNSRLTAGIALVAIAAMSAGPAPAATAPAPAPSPLKTITHIHSSPLCTGLRRAIGPAVRSVLQNDHYIAESRPLLQSYAKNSATGSKGAADLNVARMESLISPLVSNTEAIEKYLSDPIFERRAKTDGDKQLLAMRAHLAAVLQQQKQALDLISGFIDTQQMGELQAAGHDYDKAINGSDVSSGKGQTPTAVASPNAAPTAATDPILNAGLSTTPSDPKNTDPRYQGSGNTVGYNPLNVFDQQVGVYQQSIAVNEQRAAKEIIEAVPVCGGRVPGQQAQPAQPAPAAPSPAPAAPVAVPSPSAKP